MQALIAMMMYVGSVCVCGWVHVCVRVCVQYLRWICACLCVLLVVFSLQPFKPQSLCSSVDEQRAAQ